MSNAKTNWFDLVDGIYDAALDDTLWTPVVGRIMKQVEAGQSMLFNPLLHSATDMPHLLACHVAEDLWPLYTSHYWREDHWAQNGARLGLVQTGDIFHGDEVIQRNQFRRTETYNDLLKQRDMEVVMCAILIGATPEQPTLTSLSLFRPPGAEAFSPQDEQLILHLMPHLQRALRIRGQMNRCQETGALREAALDHLAQAVALLDDTGRVLFANRRAEAIFRDGGGPTVVNHRLTMRDAQGASRLKEALRRAVLGVGSSVKLENPARRSQWIATFSPVRRPDLSAPSAARILLLLAEPERPPTEGLSHFARPYGLTPAETRVLEQLLQQESTQDIADTLQITIKTVRFHLSALFAKSGTSGQRELVRFYLAHPLVGKQDSDTPVSSRPN